MTLEQLEHEHVRRILGSTATIDEAAEVLGIDPSTLWRKRKQAWLDSCTHVAARKNYR